MILVLPLAILAFHSFGATELKEEQIVADKLVLNRTVSLDGDSWLLVADPQNIGKKDGWFKAPRPEAKKAPVPGTIQQVFPGYSGYAWYWKSLVIPKNPHADGRYLLRFWDLDYKGEVWVNGAPVGEHEGAQQRFDLDITKAVKPGVSNLIAVRILSPFGAPIDGIDRAQTPHGALRDLNLGGLIDDVELLIRPSLYQDDVFVKPNWRTGQVEVELVTNNTTHGPLAATLRVEISPANGGEPIVQTSTKLYLTTGRNSAEARLRVPNHILWDLKNPYLYRATCRLSVDGSASVDQVSTRFGFRDFRFADGFFRLNGKRIFWSSAHTGADTPATISVPIDPSMMRKDLLNLKLCGFTGVRFISMLGKRAQLDMADELGLLVYEESYASWMLSDSPQMAERFDRSLTGMVLRDRNHPSVVIWGLLNETGEGPVCNHARNSLPLMRRLDPTRAVMFSSGRFDSESFLNGLVVWKPETGFAPAVAYNPKPFSISGVTLFRSKEVSAISGVNGEVSCVRFVAPEDGEYTVSAKFRGTGTFSVSDVYVLGSGKTLFGSSINKKGLGDRAAFEDSVKLSKGDAVDFAVGGRTPGGGAWYEKWANNTSLDVVLTSSGGHVYRLSSGVSIADSPWQLGWMSAGASPDPAQFRLYGKPRPEAKVTNGSISNPGSLVWENLLGDQHYYPRVPHRELEIARLRTIAIDDKPLFLSEYGIGSGVDMARFIANCEMLGQGAGDRLSTLRAQYETFKNDFARLKLEEEFASPQDFLQKSVQREAAMKAIGLNALRSNPRLVGYGMTGLNDPLECGEGFITAFRELKKGTTDAIFEGLAPVRLGAFAEPVQVYSGSNVHLEAVLSNFDALPAGDYPVRVQVVDPLGKKVVDDRLSVKVGLKPDTFVTPVFDKMVKVEGPSGKYRFIVQFESGAAATGGETAFYAANRADMPKVGGDIALWGSDPALEAWLTKAGINHHAFQAGTKGKETILVSMASPAPGDETVWQELNDRIKQGSTAVFLCPDVFAKGDDPLGWLTLEPKGQLSFVSEFTFPQVYPKDEWCKRHPIFEGLPTGLMDHTFYREMIPDFQFAGLPTPDEAVAGAFRTSMPGAYLCNSLVSVYRLGKGRIVLNALRIRQEIGSDPVAERLLRNMLRYAIR